METYLIEVPLTQIDPDPEQPRKFFDQEELENLARSIKSMGLLQPITVRPNGDRFTIIMGERRWRAHKIAKLKEIRCMVHEMEGNTLRNAQALENMSRERMLPSEEALAIDRGIEGGQTYEQLSKVLGKGLETIKGLHSLLKLPEVILREVDTNLFPLAVAKAVARFPAHLMEAAYHKTRGKGIAEAKEVLRVMDLELRQATAFDMEEAEKIAELKSRTLLNLEAFKAASHALFAADPKELTRWITAQPGHLDVLEGILTKVGSLAAQIRANVAERATATPATGEHANLSPAKRAWVTMRARRAARETV